MSVLIGASSVAQLEQNVAALDHFDFTTDDLANIDRHVIDGGIDLWRTAATPNSWSGVQSAVSDDGRRGRRPGLRSAVGSRRSARIR